MNAYSILVIISLLIILSYCFNYLSGKLRIPSVLLLISAGIGLQYMTRYTDIVMPPTGVLLEVLGISGLIFIVLEASLDLTIEKQKLGLIGKALLSAAVILVLNSAVIASIFKYYYIISVQQAIIHAIPLSVISSAIAIPSVGRLDPAKREFIIYESTFSDILGIILFNYMSMDVNFDFAIIGKVGMDAILIFLISLTSSFLLLLLLKQSGLHVKFFLSFAVLILVYSFGKFLHLPSLIVVLVFGLILNNIDAFQFMFRKKWISKESLNDVTRELKMITSETAFIIRTFFFLLFGFSIQLELLSNLSVIVMGLTLVLLTVAIRFIFMRYLLKITSAPLTLIAPRGLITVILFYSIPPYLRIEAFSEGILFIIIFATGIIMTIGLFLNKEDLKEKINEVL